MSETNKPSAATEDEQPTAEPEELTEDDLDRVAGGLNLGLIGGSNTLSGARTFRRTSDLGRADLGRLDHKLHKIG